MLGRVAVVSLAVVVGIGACADESGHGEATGASADAGDGASTGTQGGEESTGSATADGTTGETGDADGTTGENGDADAGTTGDADTGGSSTGGEPTLPAPEGFFALPAQGAVGLEWQPVEGAHSYNLYMSLVPGVTPQTGLLIPDVQRNHIHRNRTDGTTYYYVVTATDGVSESPPAAEVEATPGGAFVLNVFGNGDTDAIVADDVDWVPVEDRLQVLLLGDGYLESELDTYARDVDDYVEEIFDLGLFPLFRESFVIWSAPAASDNHVGDGDTVYDMGSDYRAGNNTAAMIWLVIDQLPYEPNLYPDNLTLNLVVGMMVLNPNSGRSGGSGYMTEMYDVATGRSVRTGFSHNRAHEISHAIGFLSDEYYDTGHGGTSTFDDTRNIWGSQACDSVPWRHLLHGTAINPDTDELVGAFGSDGRYHAELLCMMNGTHDNSSIYGGNGNLRTTDRFCNWCRELMSYRVLERTGLIDDFDVWKSDYRAPFWEKFGFQTPATVPQQNSSGEGHFTPCQ